MTQGLLGLSSETNMYMYCIEGMQFTLFTQLHKSSFLGVRVVEAHVSLWLVNILIFSLKSANANGTKLGRDDLWERGGDSDLYK